MLQMCPASREHEKTSEEHALQTSVRAYGNRGCLTEMLFPCPWVQSCCASLGCAWVSPPSACCISRLMEASERLQHRYRPLYRNAANRKMLLTTVFYVHLYSIKTIELNRSFLTLLSLHERPDHHGPYFCNSSEQFCGDSGSIFWYICGHSSTFVLFFPFTRAEADHYVVLGSSTC